MQPNPERPAPPFYRVSDPSALAKLRKKEFQLGFTSRRNTLFESGPVGYGSRDGVRHFRETRLPTVAYGLHK